MKRCPQCREEYPDDCVNHLTINNDVVLVCALCALEMLRKAHHNPNYEFTGPVAKRLYDTCHELRERRTIKLNNGSTNGGENKH
jgi:hypothetical protein